ncbi:MAG: UDP-N-acetylglucosamine--N-acetylmuramyl-(pentapeptide) pyrophosphoryl-undecaprenol N-acetylglucosamine transferase [Candidatus Peregrinibacteria bacterium Gr01-1014_25]|nr:MAG: UDP-N-acetylglucosamine--N-acetylmuramyl-(pentapeptide) pyrophosphoryl-undecaprenol N-acetylglucosamine transferase [Candidatus Peregrinibacteria bacterium Gr01-1014_25]
MTSRVLLVGGGSLGHVAPLIAVWKEMQTLLPHASAHVLCAKREDEIDFCRDAGLPATGLPRLRSSPTAIVAFLRGFVTSWRVIRARRPSVVFCKGGSLSIPAVITARIYGIPVVLHESDAVIGRANRFLAWFAKSVCTGQRIVDAGCQVVGSHCYHPTSNISHLIFTGNPVRPEMTRGRRAEGLRITGLKGDRPILLVLGGSQGAQAINEAVVAQLPQLLASCDVIHITGRGKHGAAPQTGYVPLTFARGELAHIFAIATLAVTRGGAGSISELTACAVPMLIVPIRGLAQDHQWKNARAAERLGIASVLEQDDLPRLAETVSALLVSQATLDAMRERARRQPADAARRIAKVVLDILAQENQRP